MIDTKKEQERDELHRAIWAIADELRGAVDGWDFKNYVAANSAGLKQGVTDRQGGVFNPDFDNAEQVIITAYGEITDIDDAAVSKGDVICAAISDDGEIMLIKIRNTAVTGRVTYLGKDGDSDRIGTDRGEYTAVLYS